MKLKAMKYFTSPKVGNIKAGQEFETDDKVLIKSLVENELVHIPDHMKQEAVRAK